MSKYRYILDKQFPEHSFLIEVYADNFDKANEYLERIISCEVIQYNHITKNGEVLYEVQDE